jgi:hypothetical protein
MNSVRFRFFRNFDWHAPHPYCVLCKFVIWAFKKTDEPIEIPEAAALEAEAAGAGERVEAAVPLPDGRTIPITRRRKGSGS